MVTEMYWPTWATTALLPLWAISQFASAISAAAAAERICLPRCALTLLMNALSCLTAGVIFPLSKDDRAALSLLNRALRTPALRIAPLV